MTIRQYLDGLIAELQAIPVDTDREMSLADVGILRNAFLSYVGRHRHKYKSPEPTITIACPDCGPVYLVPTAYENAVPVAGECPVCGDSLFFAPARK